MWKQLLTGLAVFVGVLALVGAAYFLVQPRRPAPPAAFRSIAELEAYLGRLTQANTPPGLSLVVVKDGELVYQTAAGQAAPGIPAAPDSVYHWWSMTKVVTAYAALQLAETGQLDLDAPVSAYLPFFTVQGGSEPSVRQLLNHSAGVGDATPAMIGWVHYEGDPPVDQTELLERVWPEYNQQKYTPGSQTSYTNLGYIVLGAVIEAAGGMEYEQAVRTLVLDPLGMSQTGFIYTPAMQPAAGSHPRYEMQALMLPLLVKDVDSLISERSRGRLWFETVYTDYTPSTGLIGPVTDAARFLQAYLNRGLLDGTPVLNESVIARMTAQGYIPAKAGAYLAQGYGWQIGEHAGNTYLEHRGGGPGFGTILRAYPATGLGIVLMGNDTTVEYRDLLDRMAEMDW